MLVRHVPVQYHGVRANSGSLLVHLHTATVSASGSSNIAASLETGRKNDAQEKIYPISAAKVTAFYTGPKSVAWPTHTTAQHVEILHHSGLNTSFSLVQDAEKSSPISISQVRSCPVDDVVLRLVGAQSAGESSTGARMIISLPATTPHRR